MFFDVEKGESCNNYKEVNSLTGYNGLNGTGDQNSCLKFYVIDNTDEERYSLILDHNTTAQSKYNDTKKPNDGPKSGEGYVLYDLKEDTKDWKGTEKPANYTYQNIVASYVYADYVIDYTGYKARILTAEELWNHRELNSLKHIEKYIE